MDRGRLAAIALGLAGLAAPAAAQVNLHPNQISGSVSFTNVNPEITAYLDALRLDTTSQVYAKSLAPESLSARTGIQGPSARSSTYELTVDTTDSGLSYDLQPYYESSLTYFSLRAARADVVLPEPAPDVHLDVQDCVTLVRVRFIDDLGQPVTVRNISLKVATPTPWLQLAPNYALDLEIADATQAEVPASADGLDHDVTIGFTTGTDSYHDTLRFNLHATVALECDAVKIIDVLVVPGQVPGSGTSLSRIVGTLDLIGYDEKREPGRSTLLIAGGPWGNERLDFIDRDPSCGPFELENLVASGVSNPPRDWAIRATSYIGSGPTGILFDQRASLALPEATTIDMGETFVVDPALARTHVRLVGPPDLPDPLLSHVQWTGDGDGDGVPDASGPPRSGVIATGGSTTANPFNWVGYAMAGIDFRWDASTQELSGPSLLPFGGAARTGGSWDIGDLMVVYLADSPSDPASWSRGTLHLGYGGHARHAEPHETIDVAMSACVSEVRMRLISDGAAFAAPQLRLIDGRFDGIDFEGNDVTYWPTIVEASGTPSDVAGAATEGFVRALIPEGDWTVRIDVTAVNPGGGTSNTELVHFPLAVGCRQLIDMTNTLRLELDDLEPCTGPGWIRIAGRVTARVPVARIAWSLDGGPWTDACTACGPDPSFAFDVHVTSADSRLVVKAWDESGLEASVTAFTSLTGEPSALDLDRTLPPLLVTKAAGGLALTWEPRPVDTYTVHEGTIAALRSAPHYDHRPIAATCRQHGAAAVVPISSIDTYYLVTEACDYGNGSFGRDSFGRERPPARVGCP